MATKNTMTPSGGIFQSYRGGALGFGNPNGNPPQYRGREVFERFGDVLMLQVPGARTPVRQEVPRELTGFLGELAFRRRFQAPQRTQLTPAYTPQRTQLPQRPGAAPAPPQPMH